jgi:hypothetical protein
LRNSTTPIKKEKCYIERSEKERAEYQRKIAGIPVPRRIYIDESGLAQFYNRERAWSPRGKKVCSFIPGRKFTRVNVVAGLCDGKRDWFSDSIVLAISH